MICTPTSYQDAEAENPRIESGGRETYGHDFQPSLIRRNPFFIIVMEVCFDMFKFLARARVPRLAILAILFVFYPLGRDFHQVTNCAY